MVWVFLGFYQESSSRGERVATVEYARAYDAQFTILYVSTYCRVCLVAVAVARRAVQTPAAGAPPPGPAARTVAPQLPRAFVAYSMRHRSTSDIIWIYIIFALSSTFTSHICGFAKSPTSINGLYCKVPLETIRFVRSAMEFLVWPTERSDVFGTWLRSTMVAEITS